MEKIKYVVENMHPEVGVWKSHSSHDKMNDAVYCLEQIVQRSSYHTRIVKEVWDVTETIKSKDVVKVVNTKNSIVEFLVEEQLNDSDWLLYAKFPCYEEAAKVIAQQVEYYKNRSWRIVKKVWFSDDESRSLKEKSILVTISSNATNPNPKTNTERTQYQVEYMRPEDGFWKTHSFHERMEDAVYWKDQLVHNSNYSTQIVEVIWGITETIKSKNVVFSNKDVNNNKVIQLLESKHSFVNDDKVYNAYGIDKPRGRFRLKHKNDLLEFSLDKTEMKNTYLKCTNSHGTYTFSVLTKFKLN